MSLNSHKNNLDDRLNKSKSPLEQHQINEEDKHDSNKSFLKNSQESSASLGTSVIDDSNIQNNMFLNERMKKNRDSSLNRDARCSKHPQHHVSNRFSSKSSRDSRHRKKEKKKHKSRSRSRSRSKRRSRSKEYNHRSKNNKQVKHKSSNKSREKSRSLSPNSHSSYDSYKSSKSRNEKKSRHDGSFRGENSSLPYYDPDNKKYQTSNLEEKFNHNYSTEIKNLNNSRNSNLFEHVSQSSKIPSRESSSYLIKKSEDSKSASNTNSSISNDSNNTSSYNMVQILKKIEVPRELRLNPQEATKYQMEELRKRTEEITGVRVPSFYSSTAINPLVYAEQQKKRKLLWSKAKDNENTTTTIVGRAIVEGQDKRTAEKFRKLMGIKSDEPGSDASENKDCKISSIDKIQKMQKQAFEAFDKEYQFARMATHTHRGMGLGFASYGATNTEENQKQN